MRATSGYDQRIPKHVKKEIELILFQEDQLQSPLQKV